MWGSRGGGGLCRLVLVPNPPEHLGGDFSLDGGGRLVRLAGGNSLTYSGVGVFSPQMFSDLCAGESAGLGPMLFSAAEAGRADYEVHNGAWFDIGRPASLARARREWKGRGWREKINNCRFSAIFDIIFFPPKLENPHEDVRHNQQNFHCQ